MAQCPFQTGQVRCGLLCRKPLPLRLGPGPGPQSTGCLTGELRTVCLLRAAFLVLSLIHEQFLLFAKWVSQNRPTSVWGAARCWGEFFGVTLQSSSVEVFNSPLWLVPFCVRAGWGSDPQRPCSDPCVECHPGAVGPTRPPHLSGLLPCRQTRPLVPDVAPGSWASARQQEGVARGGGRRTRARELDGCSGELCVSLRIPGVSGPGSCVSANPRVCVYVCVTHAVRPIRHLCPGPPFAFTEAAASWCHEAQRQNLHLLPHRLAVPRPSPWGSGEYGRRQQRPLVLCVCGLLPLSVMCLH